MAKITDKAVMATIAALEAELNDAAMLAKAEGSPPAESSDDSASPPVSDDSAPASPPADDGSAPASPAPEAPGAAPEAPPEAAGAAPMDPAAQAPGAAPMDPAALQAEYAQLAPEELDMHIQAAMAAKEALAGAASAGAPPMAPPGASPAPAPAASPAPAGPPMMGKGELTAGKVIPTGKENGGIAKSETDSLKAELAELKKSIADKNEDVELLTKAVKMVIEKPQRKAITSVGQLQYLGKSEAPAAPQKTYTKAEADAKLSAILPSLSKSERNLVVQYSLGRVEIGALESILDKASK